MLTLLSPAKKLYHFSEPYLNQTSHPQFIKKAKELAQIMKTKSQAQIADLMKLSNALAHLNYDRYQNFDLSENPTAVYPALFLFQGDVYQGLEAKKWTEEEIQYAQSHLAILSGLYGLLRPLDTIQPYRLEMGVGLSNPSGETLYDFWRETISNAINEELAQHVNPLLINLASTEYFKAVDGKKLKYPVLTINFYERKNNEVKMIGIHAKKARGVMAKFLMCKQIDESVRIKDFKELGYQFSADSSSEHHFDFIRSH
jgi:cytoplasmic iron level regulating protein YaaA (DUF328/UPF0246 family)